MHCPKRQNITYLKRFGLLFKGKTRMCLEDFKIVFTPTYSTK